MRLPTERVGAAVVCNTQEQEPEDLVRDVLRVFVPKLGEPRPSEPGKVEPAHLEIDPATLAGAYLAEEGEELRVIEESMKNQGLRCVE